LKLRTEFNPVGRLNAPQNETNKLVQKYEDIAVYLKSAPEGFTLKENELQVKDGYNHKVLGEVKVLLANPPEDSDWISDYKKAKQYSKNELQKEAFERGANAIIYCVITTSDEPTQKEIDLALAIGFATGWAVIVEDKYLK
jgi:hypothetical protein